MKVSVDFDCTPEELRRLMGLPDMSPVHQAYIERMAKAVGDATGGEAVGEMLRSFGPMSDAGMKLWRGLFERPTGGSAPAPTAPGEGGATPR